MTNRPFDLIIFGVTGYTGTYCLRNFFKIQQNLSKNYRLAVAGRSRDKVKDVLQQVGQEINRDLVNDIPIIEANVRDVETLTAMTSQCNVLVNAVGPYIKYGYPVVEACVETKTHHIDISGEPQYLYSIYNNFDAKAQEKHLFIINACGYDSIPSDCGSVYLKDHFPDICFNQVESYLRTTSKKGSCLNHGTFDSFVASVQSLGLLKRLLFKNTEKRSAKKYKPAFPLQKKLWPHKDAIMDRWAFPFTETDRHLVQRTQQALIQDDSADIPIQFQAYFYTNLWVAVVLIIYIPILVFLCLFRPTRKFVKDHPAIFTAGLFTKTGPTAEQVKHSSFEQYLVAKGWPKNTLKGSEPTVEPNVTKILHIKGPEIAYDATSILMMVSAITVLEDLHNHPNAKAGVLSPGYAFRNTKLIDRLRSNGIEFNVMDN